VTAKQGVNKDGVNTGVNSKKDSLQADNVQVFTLIKTAL
jgi:hypothetical protein